MFMVYQFVVDQLSSEEKIECECEIPNGVLYATNKRIIKFDHIVWWSGIRFQDLDYKHIVSIKFEVKRYYWLLLVALFVAFGAAVLRGQFGAPDNVLYSVLFFAIIIAILAFLKRLYLCFYAPSIPSRDWIISYDAGFSMKYPKEFIQTVRKHCFFDKHPSSE